MIEGLTEAQSKFVKTYILVPRFRKRKEKKAKRKKVENDFRDFNVMRRGVEARIEMVEDNRIKGSLSSRLEHAEETIMANTDTPDFDGGLTYLNSIDEEAKMAILQQDVLAEFETVKRRVEAMEVRRQSKLKEDKDFGYSNQSDIDLVWGYVQDVFEDGMVKDDPARLQSAIAAIGRLEGLIDSAVEVKPFKLSEDELGDISKEAREGRQDEIQTARRELTEIYNTLANIRAKLVTEFTEPKVPGTLDNKMTDLDGELDDAVDAPAKNLPAHAVTARQQLDALAAASEKAIGHKNDWDRKKALLQPKYDLAKGHPQVGEATYVKPEFDPIKLAYEEAKLKAEQNNHQGAVDQIKPLRDKCLKFLDFADSYARYAEIEPTRSALVTGMTAYNGTYQVVKDVRKIPVDLLSGAHEKRDDGDFTEAVKILEKIPPAVDEFILVNSLRHRYENDKVKFDGKLADATGYEAKVKAPLTGEIKVLSDTLTEADRLANDVDMKQAMEKFRPLSKYSSRLLKQLKIGKQYFAERDKFDTRLVEVKACDGKKGKIAITGYWDQIHKDEAQMDNWLAGEVSDYGLALAVAKSTKPADHTEFMRIAGLGKEYEDLLEDARTQIEELERDENAKFAAESIAMAKTARQTAVDATASDQWDLAIAQLKMVAAQLRDAKESIRLAGISDGLINGTTLDGIDTDFDAALREFMSVYKGVSNFDKKNWFTAKLEAAKATAESGRALVTGDSKDVEGAKALIKQAVDACKEVTTGVTLGNQYESILAPIEAQFGTLETGNLDDCIKTEVDAARAAVRDAKAAAAKTPPEFDKSIKELSDVMTQVRIGKPAAKCFKNHVKPTRTKVKNILDEIDDAIKDVDDVLAKIGKPELKVGFKDEINRLKKFVTDMNAAFANRKIPEAEKLAKDAVSLCDPYIDQAKLYAKVMDRYDRYVIGKDARNIAHASMPSMMKSLQDSVDGVEDLIEARVYTSADAQLSKVSRWIKKYEAAEPLFDAWEIARDAALAEIDLLEDRSDPAAGPAHAEVVELRARFDDAVKAAGLENFKGATKRLDGFVAACGSANTALDAYVEFTQARDRALAAYAEIEALDTSLIAPLFARLTGLGDNAQAKADSFDFEAAKRLFNQLTDDCPGAKNTERDQKALAKFKDSIGDVPENDSAALKVAIEKAMAMFEPMKGKPSAMYVPALIIEVATDLKTAEDNADDDFGVANDALQKAVPAIQSMGLEMDQLDQLGQAYDVARGLNKTLTEHKHYAFAKTKIDAEWSKADTAMLSVRSDFNKRAASNVQIEEAISALRELNLAVGRYEEYADRAEDVVKRFEDDLAKHTERHTAKPDIVEGRAAIARAQSEADSFEHAKSLKELDKVEDRIKMGLLRIKLAANTPPSIDELKEFLSSEEGIENLDEVIEGLDPATKRKIVNMAFEARFGCKLEMSGVYGPDDWADDERAAPNVRRFYDLMSDLPDSDTLDNDSMLLFFNKKESGASSYNSSQKRVAMREGPAKTSIMYGAGQEAELGTIKDEWSLEEGMPVTQFSWNTLHEVAHAVDDKLGFMNKNLNQGVYAGWRSYESNVLPIAKALEGKLHYDAAYTAEYIIQGAGSKPPTPECPDGVEPEEWERRRKETESWVDRTRSGENPWKSQMSADNCTIGDRVYHESAKGRWFSYAADARAQGVSGYQFRAPGEWFSELYAAFHTKKMKTSHPAWGWLNDLSEGKDV